MAKVQITETVLRDAQQSLIATKMKTEEMLPVLSKLDSVGYYSLEAWGGATFDATMRFLDEDPWERLRRIRGHVSKTKLQMLLRGQNLLGYKNYADDVVEYFVKKTIANGIDIIRIFDALNDLRNLETAIKACKKEGGHAQGCFCYTTSPVHNLEFFVQDAKNLVEMGADSICIKDMAGLLTPYVAFDLIKALKENVKVPIQLHTHYTSGVASMTYLKAIEANIDAIDCAISPMAFGTSQPATESMVAALKGTEYDTDYDLGLLSEIADYFRPLKEKYISSGLLDVKKMNVDINALIYQVPGGMLSNLISHLKQYNASYKYEEVLKEVLRVRGEFGYPPLVTPTSQIVGTQALLNVITVERYKMVPKESKMLVKGEYGKTPAPIPENIRKTILGDEPCITCRPADLIAPELDKIRNQINGYIEQDEDILSYVLLPQVAKKFIKGFTQIWNSDEDVIIDYEVIAVISAAVISINTTTGSKFAIRSFRRIPQISPAWSLAGRVES